MKLILNNTLIIFILILVASCQQPKTLPNRLAENFNVHLKKFDSSATLDSLNINWKANITERLGKIIDDTIYIRELKKIKMQLSNAVQTNLFDSIKFYQSEINYMQLQTDSISKLINKADTAKKYGYMMMCTYYISKNFKTKMDSTLIIIDSSAKLQFTQFMDSSITQTLRKF